MKRVLKALCLGLVLTFGMLFTVNAKTIDVKTTDDLAAKINEAEAGDVLNLEKGTYTLAGKLKITKPISIVGGGSTIAIPGEVQFDFATAGEVKLENVIFDGKASGTTLLNFHSPKGTFIVDNCNFVNYIKAGIYVDSLANLTVTKSTFDAVDTDKIGNITGSTPEHDLMRRSAAGIDINFGNDKNVKSVVNNVILDGNTFKNVVATEKGSTAGGVKIKVKDKACAEIKETVLIKGNTFDNNTRDIVLGTDSSHEGTTPEETANFNIRFVDNKVATKDGKTIKVVLNNAKKDDTANYGREEIFEATDAAMTDALRNYKTGLVQTVVTRTDAPTIAPDTFADLDEGDKYVVEVKNEKQNYSWTFEGKDVKLADDTPRLNTTITISDKSELKDIDTAVKGLKTVRYLTFAHEGKLPGKALIHYDLGKTYKENAKVTVYHFDEETKKLEKIGTYTVKDGAIDFTIEHCSTYVLADETPDVKNPETSDSILTYVGLFIVSASLVGCVLYLKKRSYN